MGRRCAAVYCQLVRVLDFSVGSHETIAEMMEKVKWSDPVNDLSVNDAFAG